MIKEKRKRRQFSKEFKLEAVELSNRVGPTQAAKDLDIASSALNRWRNEFSNKNLASTKEKPSYEELSKENRKLKRELGYMQEINKVLKKSTAIFSKDQMDILK